VLLRVEPSAFLGDLASPGYLGSLVVALLAEGGEQDDPVVAGESVGDPSCRRAEREAEFKEARRRALGRMAFVPWNRGRRVGRWRRRCGSSRRRRGSTSTRRSRRGVRRQPHGRVSQECDYRATAMSGYFSDVFASSTPPSPAGPCRSPTMPARPPATRTPSPFPNTDRLVHSYTYAPQVLHVFGNALGWMRPHISERVSERIRAALLGHGRSIE
jgi:hypothetical protein